MELYQNSTVKPWSQCGLTMLLVWADTSGTRARRFCDHCWPMNWNALHTVSHQPEPHSHIYYSQSNTTVLFRSLVRLTGMLPVGMLWRNNCELFFWWIWMNSLEMKKIPESLKKCQWPNSLCCQSRECACSLSRALPVSIAEFQAFFIISPVRLRSHRHV